MGSTALETILRFVNRTVFISFLAIEYLGINSLFTEILSVLSLAELGVGSAIVYALYKPLAENDKERITSLMRFYRKCYIAIGIGVTVLGLAIMPLLQFIVKVPKGVDVNIYVVYVIFLLSTSISYFYSYKTSLMTADQKGYVLQIFRSVNIVVTVGLQIAVLALFKNYYLYIIVQLVMTLLFNIVSSSYATYKYPLLKEKKAKRLDKQTLNSLAVNIRSLVIIKFSSILVNSTDNMIISAFKGLKSVGLLANYNMFVAVLNTFLAKVFDSITASVGSLNAEGDSKKSLDVFYMLSMLNFWLYGFVGVGLYVLSNDIIVAWIGKDYLLSENIVLILAINLFIFGMQNAVWNYKHTFGLFKYGRYLLVLTAVINLGLSLLLGKYMGVAGILIATSISRILTNVWYEPYAVFKYGIHRSVIKYYFNYVKYFITYIAMLFATMEVGNTYKYLGINNIFLIIVFKLICILLVPNIIVFIIVFKTKEFKEFTNRMRNLFAKEAH